MTRRMSRVAAALFAIAGATAMLGGQQPASAPGAAGAAPTLILSNGKIITVDDRFTIAQAVAVRDDRIVAVGTNQEIGQLAGPGTRRIDLRGRAVIPGLIDNHMHLLRAGATWQREVRWDGVDSRKQRAPDAGRQSKGAWARASGSTTSAAGRSNSSPTTRSRSRAKSWIRSRPTIRSCSRRPTMKPI